MPSVDLQNSHKLNRLMQLLPEGIVVDSRWMEAHGYSSQLRSQYVSAGWLEQPARRVYQRPRGALSWQQVVISLQTMLRFNLVVGGRTALEEQGYAHYLRQSIREVMLIGPDKPPSWLKGLLPEVNFIYCNDLRLLDSMRATAAPHDLEPIKQTVSRASGITAKPWGQWAWPLCFSTPERAVLEVLAGLPDRESFHQVDMLMDGLTTLSPARLNALLTDCRSIKVKRLFFFFAERHDHAWLKRLDRASITLGVGKRVIFKGGRLDPTYSITVPRDLDDGLQ